MKYVMTPLEDLVQQIYQCIDIRKPGYPIEDIADRMGIHVLHFRLPFSVPGSIFINPQLSKEKQREVFAHELCHELYHAGPQLRMPLDFRLKQETQARNFALHFCIPTFMLLNQKLYKQRALSVDLIAQTYGVTHEFADIRLTHYERQIKATLFYEKLNHSSLFDRKDTNVSKQSKATITV